MITLSADHYFHIGRMHLTGGKPAQDYATSGLLDGGAYGIVSDGCSSGGDTDVGARIISLSVASAIREHWSSYGRVDEATAEHINFSQFVTFRQVQKTLGLSQQDMLATYAYVYLSSFGGIAHMKGDGVIASKWPDGSIEASRFEWQGNMPFYTAYESDRYRSFVEAHGGDLDAFVLKEDRVTISPDGSVYREERDLTLREGIEWLTINYSFENPEDIPSYVAVFSDGVNMVDGMAWEDVVAELLSFKNTAGSFAKRRAIRAIKDANKNGRGPIDDIAYSVVKITQEEVTDDTD